MATIKNSHGVEIDYDVAVNLMDDDTREDVVYKYFPQSDQAFFDRYCEEHEARFCEEWELAKPNPQY